MRETNLASRKRERRKAWARKRKRDRVSRADEELRTEREHEDEGFLNSWVCEGISNPWILTFEIQDGFGPNPNPNPNPNLLTYPNKEFGLCHFKSKSKSKYMPSK